MSVSAPSTEAYVPDDPNIASQWHLSDINVTAVWPDYTGLGVRVVIIDDGFDLDHPDLAFNFDTLSDYDFLDLDDDPQAGLGNPHGTGVTGIIGALDNDEGGVGVAYDATLVGLRIGFGAAGTLAMFADAMTAAAAYDVSHNSWGYSTPFVDDFETPEFAGLGAAMEEAAQNGRGGLGTVLVFSGGNAGSSGDNANYHNLQNAPYAIAVSAYDSTHAILSYASPGANILLAAPGRGIVTTDVSGANGYGAGDYVSAEGTSFAAPAVSGVAALMLEANPLLGYRDVQEILVYSARQIGAASGYQANGAGLHFSHQYGFGALDAHAAVRLAETWDAQSTADNLLGSTYVSTAALSIPDGSGSLVSTLNVGEDITLDHVQIRIDIDHANAGQLEISLTSPDGTISYLADNPSYTDEMPAFTFSSVAHWGESSQGAWILRIADTVAGTAGLLNGWSLTLQGDAPSADQTFIYTDEYKALITPLDADGGTDTINMAARTGNASLNLAGLSGIENAYTGDGNDDVTGSALDNRILTGRGNDTITGSAGHDVIDGGAGDDTFLSFDAFAHAVTINGTGDITLIAPNGDTTRLIGIEDYNFAGRHYTLADLITAAQTDDPVDVVYAVHGQAGVAILESVDNGLEAYTAQELNIGGSGVVLLAERTFDHLTLTNNAGPGLEAATMHVDDGLALTMRGFEEINIVADGTGPASIDIGGAQRGFIQTAQGDDTVSFLGFLFDAGTPLQDRTLVAATGGGNDTLGIEDRSGYLSYDIDMGDGDDRFYVQGALDGYVYGGYGADTFAIGPGGGVTGILDFYESEGDVLDLSALLENRDPNDPIANFIEFSSCGCETEILVNGDHVATLFGTDWIDPVQNYVDNGVIVVD